MLKRVLLMCTASVLVALVSSCIFDPKDDGGGPPPPPQYPDLNQKNEVLQALELAYNNRAITEYRKVLDQNFTMFFSSGDFNGGKTPEQWNREDEVDANTNLFDRAYTDTDPSNGVQPRCTGISMDVKWEDGVQWQLIHPASAPEEEWFTATVFYNFQFDIEPDLHLINNPSSKAQFTVRNAGTAEKPHWQLVELRDLDGEV